MEIAWYRAFQLRISAAINSTMFTQIAIIFQTAWKGF